MQNNKKVIKDTQVFVPEQYLSLREKKSAIYHIKFGIGKVYTQENFNKMLKAQVINNSVVVDFAFIIH